MTDLLTYYTSQGKFADDFAKMTNVPLEKISNTEAFLVAKNKKCIKFSLGDKELIAQKGTDSGDKI